MGLKLRRPPRNCVSRSASVPPISLDPTRSSSGRNHANAIQMSFVFTKWFFPEDDPAGSKHGGRILKERELTSCVYCDSIFPLLIVEVGPGVA